MNSQCFFLSDVKSTHNWENAQLPIKQHRYFTNSVIYHRYYQMCNFRVSYNAVDANFFWHSVKTKFTRYSNVVCGTVQNLKVKYI